MRSPAANCRGLSEGEVHVWLAPLVEDEDRTAKFPIEQIARATRGTPLPAAGPEQQAHNVAAMKASATESATDTVAPGPAPVPVTIGERPE